MVIGVLPDAAAAETLLNNLAEAEFNLADVSVLMRDEQQRQAERRKAQLQTVAIIGGLILTSVALLTILRVPER